MEVIIDWCAGLDVHTVAGHRVAEPPARAEIEDRRQVQPAFTGRDVGDVLAPRHIGLTGCERSTDEVGDPPDRTLTIRLPDGQIMTTGPPKRGAA